MPSRTVNVLWTGGWDSTFRILQLIRETDAVIQPLYVIDTERPSTLLEIRTMSVLRKSIERTCVSSSGRILPHWFFSIHEIPANAEITGKYERLKRQSHLGSQYDWLARLAQSLDARDWELAVHRDDKAYGFIKDHVVKRVDEATGEYYVLDVDRADGDLSLFGLFRFPVLDWPKTEMRAYAARHGLLDIMRQTWFCFRPVGERPCGFCTTCRYAIEEGMCDRFSRGALLLNRLCPLWLWPKAALRRAQGHFLRSRKRTVADGAANAETRTTQI